MFSRRGLLVLGLFVGGGLVTPSAHAAVSSHQAPVLAENEINSVEKIVPTINIAAKAPASLRTADQMLADGELLYRLKDYQRAILVYSQIEEKYSNQPQAYAEAVYRCGEALFATKDYLSARSKYRFVLDHASQSEFRAYASPSVARMVDISLRVDDPRDSQAMDEILQRIAAMSPSDVDSTVHYAKAKALYFKRDFTNALADLRAVNADTGYLHQAKFIMGVIALKQSPVGKYQAAIDAFKAVTDLTGDTDDHKEVIDLAWIAIGRLFYEMDQLDQAVTAYQHIDRTSKHFDTMLYEIAWVYVRKEDQDKAARALDLLSVIAPDSANAIEGDLLKADILLRKAEFRNALVAYEHVRDRLDPLQKKIDNYLNSNKTPGDYYDRLTMVSSEFDADALPPLVIQWAREEPNGALAFAVVDSVQQTKELIVSAQEMLDRLQVAVKGSNRVKSTPEFKFAYQQLLAQINRVSHARATIGQGLDDVEPSDVSNNADLSAVREQRRRLQKEILALPVSDDDFSKREDVVQGEWRAASQDLQQRQIEVGMLETQVGALRRYLQTLVSEKETADKAQVAAIQAKIDEIEQDVHESRIECTHLRNELEMGRVQAGLGDLQDSNDTDLRQQYRDLLEKELSLVANLGGAGNYSREVAGVMTRARTVESTAETRLKELDQKIEQAHHGLQDQLDEEQAALAKYRQELAVFDDEARLVVGEVARINLAQVRAKVAKMVMRADEGVVNQSWSQREARKLILQARLIEKNQQETLLNDELQQIQNDGVKDVDEP